ncbi:10839_t:CDS:2, partial [Racocetra fulgida]
FAKAIFKKCQALITFFKNSYHAGAALQEDIINSFIKGGGLKTSVLENQSEIFQDALNIKNILRNYQFWQNVEQLETILAPSKRAIQAVETKSSNIALCFLELVKMAIAIKKISNITDSNFKTQ